MNTIILRYFRSCYSCTTNLSIVNTIHILDIDIISYFRGTKKMSRARSLRGDVSLYLLSERVYLATRRGALGELPGMQPHYPNPNYPNPAVVLPEFEYQKDKTSLLQWG